jgi:hypothetical protein
MTLMPPGGQVAQSDVEQQICLSAPQGETPQTSPLTVRQQTFGAPHAAPAQRRAFVLGSHVVGGGAVPPLQ